MIVVSNSSPLIALARISCLDLLQALYTQVFNATSRSSGSCGA